MWQSGEQSREKRAEKRKEYQIARHSRVLNEQQCKKVDNREQDRNNSRKDKTVKEYFNVVET